MSRVCTWIAVCLLLIIQVDNVFAQNPNSPRTTLQGLVGKQTLGEIETFIPMWHGHDSLLYSDFQGKTATDDAWFAGLGIGYRQLMSNQAYGGYVFVDRNSSTHHNTFWILNPGIEILRPLWDFRINGYLPLSDK